MCEQKKQKDQKLPAVDQGSSGRNWVENAQERGDKQHSMESNTA